MVDSILLLKIPQLNFAKALTTHHIIKLSKDGMV